MALVGSSQDIAARVAAARTEEQWQGAGDAEGIQIWRVEQFKIVPWPQDRYGEFFSGDSYILLHTFKQNPRSSRFSWDVHFWLGKDSTQDEMGTAAYKTVELDDLLGCLPVQYREVQGYESEKFMNLFENKTIICLDGGVESGFRHVGPVEYEPRLFHVKGRRRVQVMQVPLSTDSLNLGDAFVLDHGLKIFTWLPNQAGATEKFRANMVAEKLVNSRGGRTKIELFRLEEEGNEEFWGFLGGRPETIKAADEVEVDDQFEQMRKETAKAIFKLSDADGSLQFTEVATGGDFDRSSLDSDDVFIIDAGCEILCWIGSGASKAEREKALLYASNYLGLHNRPAWLPITRVCEGRETPRFEELFAGLSPARQEEIAANRQRQSEIIQEQEHTVVVTVHECRDLMSKDLNHFSDPYISLTIGNESQKFQTERVNKSLNPDFEQEFRITFYTPPSRASLKVRAFDWDRFTRDDKLGKIDIPLAFLPRGKKIERVFQLQNATKGTIRLSLEAVDFGLVQAEDHAVEAAMTTLLVDVESASIDRGMQAAPVNPYVTVSVGSSSMKTHVQKVTKRPDWRGPPHSNCFAFRLNRDLKIVGGDAPQAPPRPVEEVEEEGEAAETEEPPVPPNRPLAPDHAVIRFKVRSHAKFLLKDEVLGKAMLPIGLLPTGRTVRRVFPLYFNDRPNGSTLTVSMRLVDFPSTSVVNDFF